MHNYCFSPRSWSARWSPADRVGAARSAMRGHRASVATHTVGRRAPPFGSRPGARPRRASTRAEHTMRASTVVPATLFGPLLADRTPGRDAGRDRGENCGLGTTRLNDDRAQQVRRRAHHVDHALAGRTPNAARPVRLEPPEWEPRDMIAQASHPPFRGLGPGNSADEHQRRPATAAGPLRVGCPAPAAPIFKPIRLRFRARFPGLL